MKGSSFLIFFVLLANLLMVQAASLNKESAAAEVYVSNGGDDSNDGSLASPFKTIQKASDMLTNGGTCYIRGGIYRETVTVKYNNQFFVNYNDEYVAVTGLDLVTGWTPYKGDIYQAPFDNFEPQFTQLFYEGKHQQIARYPDNSNGDMLSIDDAAGYAALEVKNNGVVTFEKALPGADDYWVGGYFRAISGLTWMNPTGIITQSSGNGIVCDVISKTWQENNVNTTGTGKGYVLHLNALDRPGEWYHQNGKIYFMKPETTSPADDEVEAQKRIYAFILDGKSGIQVKGIDIKAATVRMNGTRNSSFLNCSFRYQKGFYTRPQYHWSHTEHGGVYVKGDNNSFNDCYFYASWGNLLNFKDGEDNTVDNCIFDNNGWMGMFTSCIQTDCYNLTVTNSTFGSTGRFHIRSDKKFNVLYSDFYDCMKMGQDAGSLEVTNGGAKGVAVQLDGAEIAYNTFHDMNTLVADMYNKNFVVAIYFEGATNYTVHHNLVYNINTQYKQGSFLYLGPRECAIKDINYYNNTVWNVDKMVGVWNKNEKGSITNAQFINNIFYSGASVDWGNPSLESGVVWSNNLSTLSEAIFNDLDNEDFSLKVGMPAIDYGKNIAGITDVFEGIAPDAGCFESGVTPWISGATMAVPVFPEDMTVTRTLTVNNGSGDGIYEAKTPVLVSADVLDGKSFVRWVGAVSYLLDENAPITVLVMPEEDVTITAEYQDNTSLNEHNEVHNSLMLWPNPCSKTSPFVNLYNPSPGSLLSIFTLDGKQVSTIRTSEEKILKIEVSPFPKGEYLLSVDNKTGRFIVQ